MQAHGIKQKLKDMATAEVLSALPALYSSKTKEEIAAMPDHVKYATKLEMVLVKQKDLIIDFTSLKTCLDPNGAPDTMHPVCEQQEQQPVSNFSCVKINEHHHYKYITKKENVRW